MRISDICHAVDSLPKIVVPPPGQTLETNPATQILESNPTIQTFETNPANHLYLKPSP